MRVKLCGITKSKVLEIRDHLGYGDFLEILEESENLYNMLLVDCNAFIYNDHICLSKGMAQMYIPEDEFFKLEVL